MTRGAIAVVCLLSLGFPDRAAPRNGCVTEIDAFEAEMQALRIPGAAVAVVDDGKIVLERAYGVSNLETATPLDTSAVFELASITKQFTATALHDARRGGQGPPRRSGERLHRAHPAAWAKSPFAIC